MLHAVQQSGIPGYVTVWYNGIEGIADRMMASVVVVVVRVSKLDPNLATFACCEGFKYQHMQQPLNHCLSLPAM